MGTADADGPIRADEDRRGIELAHAALDELGVPRGNEQGQRFTLFGRIELLRAGKCDLSRISLPAAPGELRRCPACGLYVLSPAGDACPSCGATSAAGP